MRAFLNFAGMIAHNPTAVEPGLSPFSRAQQRNIALPARDRSTLGIRNGAAGPKPLRPLVPADAGTQTLPVEDTCNFGKVWIPASAGMSGCGNSLKQAKTSFVSN
jgi:hypothetical protein